MSLSSMSTELFEKTEFVSSDDPNLDQSTLVYMGSDSEESSLLQEVVEDQQEPANDDSNDTSGNPIHVSVSMEDRETKEFTALINTPKEQEVLDEEFDEALDFDDLLLDVINRDPVISIIPEEKIDGSVSFNFSEEFITKVEPPDDMSEPPPMNLKMEEDFDQSRTTNSHDYDSREQQFEIIKVPPTVAPKVEPETIIKLEVTDEPEPVDATKPDTVASEPSDKIQIKGEHEEDKNTEDGEESPNTSVADANTSLVDHPYSQPEISNKEFCDDLVQDLLKETGNQSNSSIVKLLTMFTGLLESFFDESENPQRSLYFQNMKKSLAKIKIVEQKKPAAELVRRASEPTPSSSVIDQQHPRFSEVPGTETQSDRTLETIDLTQFDFPPTQPTQVEDDLVITELKEIIADGQEVQPTESEAITKLKNQIHQVADLGKKIVDDVKEFKVDNDESIVEIQEKISSLLKETRKKFHAISNEIRASAIDINEEIKVRLITASTDGLSSDSDLDQVKRRRRKVPKSEPQTPAVVSSTKEDSDATDAGELKPRETDDLSESDDSEELRDLNKEINKLLDFTTLDNTKPASSRKVSKQKKLKKLRKRKVSDSESLLSSSSNDSRESSSSDADGEKSDEEEKMLMRQNDNARDELLADSDISNSDSGHSGLSVLFSSDEEIEDTKTKKDKSKPQEKKIQKMNSKSSDDETPDLSETDEKKEPENGVKSPPGREEAAEEEKVAKDKSDNDGSDTEVKVKKRIMRDSEEREIFSKAFLDGTPAIKKPSSQSHSSNSQSHSSHSPSKAGKKNENSRENSSDSPPDDKGFIDLSMFNSKRNVVDLDMDIFENRTSKYDGAGPSTLNNANKRPPAPIQEDECIFLSSDSDSEISAPTSGSAGGIPKRKKMLTEEELQEETKRAQKEETKRLERLKKKEETLTQMLTQRISQESSGVNDELILDYDPKTKVTISVHEKLVKCLKLHQREGIKFMYDTCYGSISDDVKTESGCILAHCMGLGKTLQLITLLHTLISFPQQLNTKRVIVICPKSTIMNWHDEIERWLKEIPSNKLKVCLFVRDVMQFNEKIKVIEDWFNWKTPSVFLVNYEAYRYMVHYSGSKRAKIPEPDFEVKRKQEIISRCLLNPGPDLVVCDEGHLIKNQRSATNRAIGKIKTRRRIVLTGTPVQNNLNEYYAMVDWIKPALLGTVKEFNNLYANPIKDGQHIDSTPQMIKKMKQRSFILNRKLSKFVQRKEVSVLREYLPELHQYCIFVPLTPVQETLYENFLALNPLDGGHQLLNDYTALRKIWTHPKVLQNAYERAVSGDLKIEENKKKARLADEEDNEEPPDDQLDIIEGNTGVKSKWWQKFVTDNDLESIISSNKLKLLFHILHICQMKEQKCLVFSSFVAVLNVVEYFMKKINDQLCDPNANRYGYDEFKGTLWKNGYDYCRLDGSTKREHRQKMIELFNDTTNTRLRCFLISAKAGGQGINLIGANRCVILDTSWNPSSDQQNIFRIYRLGQKNPCYVYRLIALGTMEEKVYSRSVTKQAMSGRVVDKRQIDRHYKMSELSELYVLTKTDHSARPNPQMPADEFLKFLLHTYPQQVYKYHDHEQLLENKPDQDLNDDEKNEAWQLYEAELSGNPRVPLNNPLLFNENFRPDVLQKLNYLATAAASSSAIDSSGLFGKYYQPSSFFNPSDLFHNLLPYDLSSYRNPLNPPATSASTSLASSNQSASVMIRNQLNANMFSPFPQLYPPLPKATTSPKPQSAPRRRSSNTTKKPLANVPKSSPVLPRVNGNILGRSTNHDLLMDTSNGSTPDKTSSKETQKTSLSKDRPYDGQKIASLALSRKLVSVRPNLNIPRPQQAHLASMPSRNSNSPSTLPGTAARTLAMPEASAFIKPKTTNSLQKPNSLLQPGNLVLPNVMPRANTSDNIYINPKANNGNVTPVPLKPMQRNNSVPSIGQRSQPKPAQQPRQAITVPVPPIPAAALKANAAAKKVHNVPKKAASMATNIMRVPPSPNSLVKSPARLSQQSSPNIQRGGSISNTQNRSQKQQSPQASQSQISIQSAYSLAADPLSATSTSSKTIAQPSVLKNIPKQSFIPQNRSTFSPQNRNTAATSTSKEGKLAKITLDQQVQQKLIDQVVARQKKSHSLQQQAKFKVVHGGKKFVNGSAPSNTVPKVPSVENSVSITKILPQFKNMPKNLMISPSSQSIAITSRNTPLPIPKVNQPTVTRTPSQTIIRSPVQTMARTASQPIAKTPSQPFPKGLTQTSVPKTNQNSQASQGNSSQQMSQNSPQRLIMGVKRKNESPLNSFLSKRQAHGPDQVVRVVPRDQREKTQQNTSSLIEDIVEIE